jgi:hypothetical protein
MVLGLKMVRENHSPRNVNQDDRTQNWGWRHYAQHLGARVVAGLTVLLAAGTTLLVPLEPSRALEEIRLEPSFLLENPLPLADLEAFVESGEVSDDLQFLLDLVSSFGSFGEEEAKLFLDGPVEVDAELVDRFLTSSVGEVLAKELVLIMQPEGADPERWEDFRDALSAASSDGQISVLEFLQNYGPETLAIDVQQATKIQKQVEDDLTDFQDILGIEITEASFRDGARELFCTAQNQTSESLLELLNSFTEFTSLEDGAVREEVQTLLAQDFEIPSALVDRFLTSYFGEVFLRHLALTVTPEDPQDLTTAALKTAIATAAEDDSFSAMEALTGYQPDQVDANVDTFSDVVLQLRQEVNDFQIILGLEGAEDVSAVVEELVCPALAQWESQFES